MFFPYLVERARLTQMSFWLVFLIVRSEAGAKSCLLQYIVKNLSVFYFWPIPVGRDCFWKGFKLPTCSRCFLVFLEEIHR